MVGIEGLLIKNNVISDIGSKTKTLKLYDPFSLILFTCLLAKEPKRGDSILLTTVPQEFLILI